MEAAMRQRLDLAEATLRERAPMSNIDRIRQEVMDEFEIVLTQMPYIGGVASRMSDFFMRLIGFMAIGRVLQRHGVSLPVIGEIERETYTAQLLTVPDAERLASGRQFMSSENQALSCRQRTKPCYASRRQRATQKNILKTSSTISWNPAPTIGSNSVSTTRPAAFANLQPAMEIKKSCRTFVGLILKPTQRAASTWNGHKL